MATASLAVKLRSTAGKGAARKLRAIGEVPAIVYGHGREPQSLAIETYTLERMLEKVSYKTTVIELEIAGAAKAKTLIREIQRHPFKRHILHVDFQELVAGEKVIVRVPLVFVGTPEGVRTGGGILDQVMHEMEITVDPANIPNHINVDVNNLLIGHSIHVGEITVPAGVVVLDEASATVCVCSIPKAVVEEVPAADAAATPAEPELIRKTKEGEEGAEGEAAAPAAEKSAKPEKGEKKK
jgi:large subunit ribosomal protein L25